jgi:HEPN domain-containing protein
VSPHELWLAKAPEDLEVGKLCFREQYFAQACFLSQQVIEKSLKVFLVSKRGSYPREHKVVKLAVLCGEIKSDLDPLKG